MFLIDLEEEDAFKVKGSNLRGVLKEKSQVSCLVILENSISYDNEGEPIKLKQKIRISSNTEVRRLYGST